MEELLLPDGFVPLSNQVAGHTFSADCKALGMLKNKNSGCLLKPLGKPDCGERELRFYEQISNINNGATEIVRCIVPKFYGKCKLLINGVEHTFLKIEDLSHGMLRPCILDIKIGQQTWDPLASAEKRQIEEVKYAKCKKVLGLCLPGFQVYRNDTQTNEITFIKHGKEYGKQLDAIGLQQAIAVFLQFDQQHNKICRMLINEYLKQLYTILDWFNMQRLYYFYASSLLFVYDYDVLQILQQEDVENRIELTKGNTIQQQEIEDSLKDIMRNDNCDIQKFTSSPQCRSISMNISNTNISRFVKVRMIDFAHVFRANDLSSDTNYVFGLKNLIKIIENLLKC